MERGSDRNDAKSLKSHEICVNEATVSCPVQTILLSCRIIIYTVRYETPHCRHRSSRVLIAGTNRDLPDAVKDGRFRDDLLARINLWTFTLPGLTDRREDISPNLDYEL